MKVKEEVVEIRRLEDNYKSLRSNDMFYNMDEPHIKEEIKEIYNKFKYGCDGKFWSGNHCGGKCNDKIMLCNDCKEIRAVWERIK